MKTQISFEGTIAQKNKRHLINQQEGEKEPNEPKQTDRPS